MSIGMGKPLQAPHEWIKVWAENGVIRFFYLLRVLWVLVDIEDFLVGKTKENGVNHFTACVLNVLSPRG